MHHPSSTPPLPQNEQLQDRAEAAEKQLKLQVLKTQAVVQKLDMLAKGDASTKLAELTGGCSTRDGGGA